MILESTKLQKEGLDTGADLAPLGRSEVEVIEEKKKIKSEGPADFDLLQFLDPYKGRQYDIS